MNDRARAAALLPVWAFVGMAGLTSTLAFTAVHASRLGCIETGVANLVSIGGIAGFGLAVSSLLLVAAVPRRRRVAPAAAAAVTLVLSLYAVIAYLAQGAACPS
jgi:hypothetical protein